MEDQRLKKQRQGVELYKAFYPALSPAERETLLLATVQEGHCSRSEAEYLIEMCVSEGSHGSSDALIKSGILCRVCSASATHHVYGRPYCWKDSNRAIYGKIGKVHGGYLVS